jgi:hypothetical protein
MKNEFREPAMGGLTLAVPVFLFSLAILANDFSDGRTTQGWGLPLSIGTGIATLALALAVRHGEGPAKDPNLAAMGYTQNNITNYLHHWRDNYKFPGQ